MRKLIRQTADDRSRIRTEVYRVEISDAMRWRVQNVEREVKKENNTENKSNATRCVLKRYYKIYVQVQQ
jgi:hypothetical protein